MDEGGAADRASMVAELERRRRVVESRFGASLAEMKKSPPSSSSSRKEGKGEGGRKSVVWSTERPDHDEAARKMAAIETGMPGPPGQALALVNKTHTGRRPASSRAGFRILGIFADVEEAAGWIQGVPGVLDEATGVSTIGDIYAVPLRRWTLLAETIEREEEEEKVRQRQQQQQEEKEKGASPSSSSKIDRMLAAHVERRKAISAEFEARLGGHGGSSGISPSLPPSPSPSSPAATKGDEESATNKDKEGEGGAHATAAPATATPVAAKTWRGADQVPAAGKLPEHAVSAVVILEDREGGGGKEEEPALMILGAWGSEEEANEYIKKTAALWILDHDVHVVDSYAWLWPSSSSSAVVKKTYRDDELSLLVESARKAAEVTRMAEESARAAGKTLPVIEIGGEDDGEGEKEGGLVLAPGETSIWPEVDRQLAARSGCTGELVSSSSSSASPSSSPSSSSVAAARGDGGDGGEEEKEEKEEA